MCPLRVQVFGILAILSSGLRTTGWGPLVISKVIRALNWVIRILS